MLNKYLQKPLTDIIKKDIIEIIVGIIVFIFILISDWKEVILKLANNLSLTTSILLISVGIILCFIICITVLKRENRLMLELLLIKSAILILLSLVAAILYVNTICPAINGYQEENFWYYIIVYFVLGIIGGGACDLLDPGSLRKQY
ncbi:MAG: hypothetical protein JSV49_09095 [Thermoplasmata archaeon]|nr:MAG: hypothetical protein JSV49_09095 [Thermoplasmata archaeon]